MSDAFFSILLLLVALKLTETLLLHHFLKYFSRGFCCKLSAGCHLHVWQPKESPEVQLPWIWAVICILGPAEWSPESPAVGDTGCHLQLEQPKWSPGSLAFVFEAAQMES